MSVCLPDPGADDALLPDLWARVFPGWSVDPDWFAATALSSPGTVNLTARAGGQPVGFALCQVRAEAGRPPVGALLALGVLPEWRGRGVGRLLHAAAVDRLRAAGARAVRLGSGGWSYFWPGVPASLHGAWDFFHHLGWRERERAFDLSRALSEYRTPAWVWERAAGVEFAPAGGAERQALALVEAEQPGWARHYARAFAEGRPEDVLLAVEGGRLVGACLVESPAARWSRLLPQPCGAPACLFTARADQGRGVGLALAARATELLQQRGCRSAFLGWTWLVDWYARLGYTVWEEYIAADRGITGQLSVALL